MENFGKKTLEKKIEEIFEDAGPPTKRRLFPPPVGSVISRCTTI